MQRHINKLNRIADKFTKKLERIYTARLIWGLLAFVSITITTFQKYRTISFVVFVLTLVAFFYFLKVSTNLRLFLNKINILKDFYIRQENRLNGRECILLPFRNPNSVLDFDLDLYGNHSVFSQISECFTDIGLKKLSSRLEKSELNVEQIITRQNTVKDFASHLPRIKKFIINATPCQTQKLSAIIGEELLSARLHSQIKAIALIWALSLAAWFVLPEKFAFCLTILFWVASYITLGKVSKIFMKSLDLGIQKLPPIIANLEKLTSYKEIKAVCPNIHAQKPTRHFARWSAYSDFLSIRSNPLLAVIINLLMPWTLVFSLLLEQTRLQLANHLESIFEDLSEFEFYMSLAVMYRYQTQTFADFTAKPYFECEGLYHPLIAKSKVVANNFNFDFEEQLALITGSNMSGKSTFLRAVGINQLLACMGAPVYAQKMVTQPSQTQTCIRVTDSIEEGASYFYAEVKRLKFIVDQIKFAPTFFLIDEVFKGTNNQERLAGARALLTTLVSPTSFGFVTTHDLELSQSRVNQLVNWHFSDDFVDGKMFFSYKIQPGPSTTTNALKIMQNEGLIKGLKLV